MLASDFPAVYPAFGLLPSLVRDNAKRATWSAADKYIAIWSYAGTTIALVGPYPSREAADWAARYFLGLGVE